MKVDFFPPVFLGAREGRINLNLLNDLILEKNSYLALGNGTKL